MNENRNPTNSGVEARGLARLAADLARPAGLDDGGPGIVIGQGDYAHNGNGRLLADLASRAIAAANPGLADPDPKPLTGIEAFAEIRDRQARESGVRRFLGDPAALHVRGGYASKRLALDLLRLMIGHPDLMDQELHSSVADLIAEVKRRIVLLDPACCPKCYHEVTAERAYDGGGDEIPHKIDMACEHCGHYERVDDRELAGSPEHD